MDDLTAVDTGIHDSLNELHISFNFCFPFVFARAIESGMKLTAFSLAFAVLLASAIQSAKAERDLAIAIGKAEGTMPTMDDELLESPEVEITTPEEVHTSQKIRYVEPNLMKVPHLVVGDDPRDISTVESMFDDTSEAPAHAALRRRIADIAPLDEYRPPLIDLDDTADRLDVNSPQLQAQRDLETLDAICLYEYDQDFRKKVDNHERYSTYKNPYFRHGKDADYEIGKDWLDAMERAGYADKGMSKMPREACRALVAGMQDPKERVKWQVELQKQDLKDKTSAVAYYEILGRIHREDVEKRYLAEAEANQAQQMEEAQLKAYANEIKMYLYHADIYRDGSDISPETRQFLRDKGMEETVDAAHKAMSCFWWQGSEGQEGAHLLDSWFDAFRYLKNKPEARKLFMQTIAERAYDSARKGKTNFVRGVGEGLVEGVQMGAHWLVGSQWLQGGEALDALADLIPGGRSLLDTHRAATKMLTGDSYDEAVSQVQADREWRRQISTFIGEFDAAIEQGRQRAEKEELTGSEEKAQTSEEAERRAIQVRRTIWTVLCIFGGLAAVYALYRLIKFLVARYPSSKEYLLPHPATITACVLLLIGCTTSSDGYYTFLRIAICAYAILAAIQHYRKNTLNLRPLLAIGIGILYNPAFPVDDDYSSEDWILANILSALLIYFFLRLKLPTKTASGDA